MPEKGIPAGTLVDVLDENGRFLFRGKVADAPSPWMFWHRVVPEGHVDLPPKFIIRPVRSR